MCPLAIITNSGSQLLDYRGRLIESTARLLHLTLLQIQLSLRCL